jgi:hypothetical protein
MHDAACRSRYIAKLGGSSAWTVSSSLVTGWGTLSSIAYSNSPSSAVNSSCSLRLQCSVSPTMGWPSAARWRRSWCVRPVCGQRSTVVTWPKAALRVLCTAAYDVSAGFSVLFLTDASACAAGRVSACRRALSSVLQWRRGYAAAVADGVNTEQLKNADLWRQSRAQSVRFETPIRVPRGCRRSLLSLRAEACTAQRRAL